MIVCKQCLEVIESHEGPQISVRLHAEHRWQHEDEDGFIKCEWCEEKTDDTVYEI